MIKKEKCPKMRFPTLAQLVERLTVEVSTQTGSHVQLSGGHRLKSGRSERSSFLFGVRSHVLRGISFQVSISFYASL